MTRETWHRLWRVVKSFWTCEVRWRARGLFAVLMGLLFVMSGLNVVNSYVGRNFMTAISSKDWSGFVRQALIYLVVFGGSTVVAAFQGFVEQRLGVLWREWMTARLIRSYLADRTYYWLKEKGTVDNPDERIADDIKTFTASALSFMLIFLNAAFTVVAFAGVLWTISSLLFGVAVGYALLGSLMTILLGRKLVQLNYRQLEREANFRSALVQLHEHADSVALMRWERRLTDRLLLRLDNLVENFRRLVAVSRNLAFFTVGYNYLIQIIPILIVAPLFIRGDVEFGVVTQSSMAFAQLLGAFSLIVNQFQSISSFAAVIVRLDALGQAVERTTGPEAAGIKTAEDGGRVAYEHLTLQERNRRLPLVKDLSGSLSPPTRLLVTGANESARGSLFRATAGTWQEGQGMIARPTLDEILFLPERPYLPSGTLREILVEPGQPASDEQVLTALRTSGLEDIVERAGGLDEERDWEAVLSLGEQQMLALTRVVLAKPQFVFLDRVGSTLGSAQVQQVLQNLSQHSITSVHFAGAGEPTEAYDAVLQIGSEGAWTWRGKDREPAPA
jgi:putative ATP-binding cassette transporter